MIVVKIALMSHRVLVTTIDITRVVKVPYTIPEGKEVLPEGKALGNYQTPLFLMGLDNYFPWQGDDLLPN